MTEPDICSSYALWHELQMPLTVLLGSLIAAYSARMGHKQAEAAVNGTVKELIGKLPEARLPDARTRREDHHS